MAGNTVNVQGNYVDVHDNEVVNLTIEKAGEVNVADTLKPKEAEVPQELAQSSLWQAFRREGLVNEHGFPTVSRTEAALMAAMLGDELELPNKWKVFERMWNRNNMRNDYNTALEQRKTLVFQERLKKMKD